MSRPKPATVKEIEPTNPRIGELIIQRAALQAQLRYVANLIGALNGDQQKLAEQLGAVNAELEPLLPKEST